MGLKVAESIVRYLIISAVILIPNFRMTHNSAPLYHPKNISKLWERSHSSKYMNTDVLQMPSSGSLPKSNRVRKSIVKNPKVNYYANTGDSSRNDQDYFYEEDTSNIKVSKTVESQPEQLYEPIPASRQQPSGSIAEDEEGPANVRSKAQDTRNIEINVELPQAPQIIPISVQRPDFENYDSELPKSSAIVSPENSQLDIRSLKANGDEVADSILNDADRLYESLSNGNFTLFPDTNDIACKDDSSYILC